ncbi:LysR substrate-binding domain-containing protein [Brevibacterium oceani]|uniref:LysR substrate-binding domain-containing protein n=1 Tax=Brevibacterium oceani TaxID=358099 RepID=UPI001B334001|nr:LysR substrate-binding domain-containing protein [Brevibacterium oceani]
MPRAVANIVAENPDAEISVVSPGAHADVSQAVRTGEADIGLVYEYAGLLPPLDVGLERTPLLSEEMVVLGRDQGPSGMRESIREFRNEPWVSGSRGSVRDSVLGSVCETAGFVPHVVHRNDDLDVIRGFVNQGLGIALVPILALGIDRTIRLYRLNEVAARRQVLLVSRTTDRNPLVDIAISAFRSAAKDFLDWTLTAFGVTFETPMLSVPPEVEPS